MKIGYRSPSPKKSFSSRTKSSFNRSLKRAVNPFYGKKGMGYINNPSKAMYNKVYNKTTSSLFNDETHSKTSLSNFSSSDFSNIINQLNETTKIINKTTNINIFFSKYNYLFECCDKLYPYEALGITTNITVNEQKMEFYNKIPDAIDSLIDRYYEKAFSSAMELKTEKGRNNRILKSIEQLINQLKLYGKDYITKQNAKKIETLLIDANLPKSSSGYTLNVENDKPTLAIDYHDVEKINLNNFEEDKENSNKLEKGCLLSVAAIYFGPLLFISIIMFILKFFWLGTIIGLIYIIICLIAYKT